MATALDVCNRALYMLGEPKIAVLSDAGHAASVITDLFFDAWRDVQAEESQAEQGWYFLIARAVLTENTSLTHYTGFTYAYGLPSDMLTVIDVDPQYPYIIEQVAGTMYLFSNYVPDTTNNYPRLIYQYDPISADGNSDPVISTTYTSLIPSWFVDTVAARMAYKATFAITDKMDLKNDLRTEYMLSLKKAQQINAQQTPGKGAQPKSWGDVPSGP